MCVVTEGIKSQLLSWKDKGPLGLFIVRMNIAGGREIQGGRIKAL